MTTTAKSARQIEPGTYEAYMHACPAVALLSTISNRWVSLTMCTLGSYGDPMRYSHISREIPGVSQKMLTQTLRMLERDGMVQRTVTPTVPVRVDYELTPVGVENSVTIADVGVPLKSAPGVAAGLNAFKKCDSGR
jgi:DNA-binding HxlR family transcriptional regulator